MQIECPECYKAVHYWNDLIEEEQDQEDNFIIKTYKCPFCNYIFEIQETK